MTIYNDCPINVQPIIINHPFDVQYVYVIGEQALHIPFDTSLIGSVDGDLICGMPEILFVTAAGSIELNVNF
jgi:hypothetical protein